MCIVHMHDMVLKQYILKDGFYTCLSKVNFYHLDID